MIGKLVLAPSLFARWLHLLKRRGLPTQHPLEHCLARLSIGQLRAALTPAERFCRFAVGAGPLGLTAKPGDGLALALVALLVAGLPAGRATQLASPGCQLVGGQLRQLGAQRLVVGGSLSAVALGRFANVSD